MKRDVALKPIGRVAGLGELSREPGCGGKVCTALTCCCIERRICIDEAKAYSSAASEQLLRYLVGEHSPERPAEQGHLDVAPPRFNAVDVLGRG
ncbi:MAG: hypothetical protein AAF581_20170 [Planctomycetota bacterium]